MDAGFVVVLAVVGFFLLVPLWLAWLSSDSRRWARVERVLGREPSRDPNELWGVWAGLAAVNLLSGAIQLLDRGRSGRPLWPGLIPLLGGLGYAVVAGVLYRRWRGDRQGDGPAGTQVQDAPEAGRPGAGGDGPPLTER